MLMRNMLVLAVAQAALGTPGTPAAATNAIQCRTAMPSPINLEFQQRTLLKGYKGNFGSFGAGEHRVIEFEVECGSSGAAGTAPRFAPLLIGCGMAETLSAGVSATYNLVNSGEPFFTLYCFLDGVRFALEDAKGSVSFEGNAKGIPVLKFRAIGRYVAMTDTPIPGGIDVTAFKRPMTVGKVNTPTFTVHGVAVKMQSFSWDLGNQLVWRELVNYSGPQSTDRAPTASVVFELDSVAASKNWGELARLGTEDALQMIHGVGAGNIFQVDMPKIGLAADPTITEVDGVAMLNTQWSVNQNSSAGLDEIVLTVK